MLGGSESRREGPWPDCLGMDGQDCIQFIQIYAKDVECYILDPDMMVTMDFRTNRVWIRVDEEGIVNQIPKRG